MAEEELAASPVPSPALTDHHKRKLEDLETPAALESTARSPSKAAYDPESSQNDAAEEENDGDDELESKRPRLEANVSGPDGLVSQNGHQEEEKGGELKDEEIQQSEEAATDNGELVLNTQEPVEESLKVVEESLEIVKESVETVTEERVCHEVVIAETENAEEPEQLKSEVEESSKEPHEELENNASFNELQEVSGTQIISRQMEVPNDKVGVLIGKAGDTIRSLQDNSGAKIQIVKDAEADPQSTTRPLELVGTLENITRAEKLIKAVIAEADAGGSPSLVARGFNTVQAAGGGEQLEIQVPIEKVGIIIGKGGETIRNLQTRSGARIQLIQQNLSEENHPTERTVRVSGSKKQIEIATDMIKDVMNQISRPSPHSSGYGQQSSRPRGGPGASQWGSRGPHHGHFSGYDYQQRGPYPSQGSQYPPPAYGNYPSQHGPRSNFGSSWEQRPAASVRGPASQGNYNYGQGPDYGHPPPYSQAPAQPYGHGYDEVRYDHHPASQHYGHMGPQQTPYAQGGTQSGYGQQDQYGKPPTYGMPPQGTHPQQYGQPRPSQPVAMPHPATQSYGQTVQSQQSYQYPSSGQMQQNYPPYGSTVSSDGYSHAPPAMTPGYPAQGGQPVAGYGQQAPAYPQPGPSGGYSSYPAAQTGYTEQQPVASNTGYGYQGQADAAYGGQAGAYTQPTQTQPTYDQSGGYGTTPAVAAYAKNASPQAAAAYPQQYDSNQQYAAPQHR